MRRSVYKVTPVSTRTSATQNAHAGASHFPRAIPGSGRLTTSAEGVGSGPRRRISVLYTVHERVGTAPRQNARTLDLDAQGVRAL